MLLPESFTPLWSPPPGDLPAGLWFVFRDDSLLVHESPGAPMTLPAGPGSAPPLPVEGSRCIGLLGGRPCWAARAGEGALPAAFSPEPLRRLFDRLDDGLLAVAGRAAQVLEFDRTHRYCGACATPTELDDGGRARRCPRCGATCYPSLSPAMMVVVTRQGQGGRDLLLARGARFPLPFYSALAGFVEPSESIEECVCREVREEVGVRVKNLRYFGSQCWPFPHSLMVAFRAEWASGEIACDPEEIADARWFPATSLPRLPHRLSVARRLIEFAASDAASARETVP